MATATSTSSGNWSAAIWSGGSGAGGAPADGDDVVIAAGHDVLMDSDLSAWTGLVTLFITWHATTPGMLYFKDGTSGWLKFRDSANAGITTTANPSGEYGRLLANSDGIWGNTTPLSFAYKAKIQFVGQSCIRTASLAIRLYCTEPTHKYVRTYYDKYTVDSIDTGTNVITCTGSHGWSANRAVRVTSSGTLPAPLDEDAIYYVGSPSGATLQLLYTSGGTAVDITSAGSGTIEIYSGYATYAGVTQLNVLDDVSADTPWTTTTNHNYCCLVNEGPQAADYQNKLTMSVIAAGYITISSALDSAQNPGARIWLSSRNVSVTLESYTGWGNIINVNYMQNLVLNAEFRSMCGSETASGNPSMLGLALYGEFNGVYSGWNQCINTNFPSSDWKNTKFSCIILCCSAGLGQGPQMYLVPCDPYIAGCTYGTYQAVGVKFTGEIRGCAHAIYNSNDITISGKIVGCNNIFNNARGCTVTSDGVIASCNYIFYDFSFRNIISGTAIGVSNMFHSYLSAYNAGTFRNAQFLPEDITAMMGARTWPSHVRITFENLNRIAGNDRVWDGNGDITKVACDGTGDYPSIDPDGGNGYCLEASNVQGGGIILMPLNIIDKMRIWLAAGAHTIAFKIQTTYTTSVDMILEIDYVSTDGVIDTATKSAAVTARSGDTDWSNSIVSDSFTTTVAGWATVTLKLAEYESGDEVYVWPMPVIT